MGGFEEKVMILQVPPGKTLVVKFADRAIASRAASVAPGGYQQQQQGNGNGNGNYIQQQLPQQQQQHGNYQHANGNGGGNFYM